MSEESLVERLQRLTKGMTYPSETDAPFDVFSWPASGGSARAAVQSITKSMAIGEQSIDTFFAELVDDDQAPQFAAIQRLLASSLTDLHVFRVGVGSETAIYLVGRSAKGEWVIVKTKSVET